MNEYVDDDDGRVAVAVAVVLSSVALGPAPVSRRP